MYPYYTPIAPHDRHTLIAPLIYPPHVCRAAPHSHTSFVPCRPHTKEFTHQHHFSCEMKVHTIVTEMSKLHFERPFGSYITRRIPEMFHSKYPTPFLWIRKGPRNPLPAKLTQNVQQRAGDFARPFLFPQPRNKYGVVGRTRGLLQSSKNNNLTKLVSFSLP